MLPLGLGAGLFQSPNNSAIMGSAPRERLGVASGLLALSRTLGQVTGMPIMGAIFASRVINVAHLSVGTDVTDAPHWAIVKGVETSFIASAGLITIGVMLALIAFLKDRQDKRVPVPCGSEDRNRDLAEGVYSLPFILAKRNNHARRDCW